MNRRLERRPPARHLLASLVVTCRAGDRRSDPSNELTTDDTDKKKQGAPCSMLIRRERQENEDKKIRNKTIFLSPIFLSPFRDFLNRRSTLFSIRADPWNPWLRFCSGWTAKMIPISTEGNKGNEESKPV